MTTTIAITGKSGSGKTTITKAFLNVLKEKYPEKSILLFDNDLAGELGHTFGLDIRNTIYGIRSGKHEYKTGIPQQMSKQEYIEWALEDIIVEVDENVDMIASWFVTPKDCHCPSTKLMRDSLKKLISRYDFVIFDCEYDLKYLMQLFDYPIDATLIVTNPTEESIVLASRITDASEKYAAEGQMGVILNKVKNGIPENLSVKLNENSLKILGVVEYDETLEMNGVQKTSKVVNKNTCFIAGVFNMYIIVK